MKGLLVFLTLALVISMAQPAEGFFHRIFHGIKGLVHGLVNGHSASEQQQEAQEAFVDKRSAD